MQGEQVRGCKGEMILSLVMCWDEELVRSCVSQKLLDSKYYLQDFLYL